MNDTLGPEARRLIDSARREEPTADAEELARIRRSVLSAASGAAALASAGKALAVEGATRFGVSSLIKASVLGSGAGALAFGVSLMLSSPAPSRGVAAPPHAPAASHALKAARPALREAPTTQQADPHESTIGERAAQPPPVARASGTVKPQSVPVAAERAASPVPRGNPARASANEGNSEPQPAAVSPPTGTLAPELALLERVQSELRAGNGQRALALLDGSSIDVEHSQLGAERLAAEVFAACQAGDLARVRRATARFLRDFPNSPSAARVRASCARAESAE